MAHVLVFFDDPCINQMLTETCRLENHDVVSVSTLEDALAVLRSTQYPLIAIVERDHSSRHPEYPLFPTIRRYPEHYGMHRYITMHWWPLSADDQALLKELDVVVLRGPCTMQQLVDAVDYAATSLNK
jgi:hypothetical protein